MQIKIGKTNGITFLFFKNYWLLSVRFLNYSFLVGTHRKPEFMKRIRINLYE